MRRLLFVALVVCACGNRELPPPNLPPFPEEAEATPRPPPGVLWRADVDAALEAGLGQFLQLVSVEPYLEGGQFVGWEVVDLRPPELWADVDLRPGDVVTGVNGMPIERDHQAFAAFESLAEADELRVSVLRGGRGHELVFDIRPMPGSSTKPPGKDASPEGTDPGSEPEADAPTGKPESND